MDKPCRTTRCAVLETNELLREFYLPEKFLPLCEACPNYGRSYACPPLDFDAAALLAGRSKLVLFLQRLRPEADFYAEKRRTDGILRGWRRGHPSCEVFSAGICTGCAECARERGLPCPRPQERIRSLDALSLDFTRLCRDRLATPLQWGPAAAYQVLLCAVLTDGAAEADGVAALLGR